MGSPIFPHCHTKIDSAEPRGDIPNVAVCSWVAGSSYPHREADLHGSMLNQSGPRKGKHKQLKMFMDVFLIV